MRLGPSLTLSLLFWWRDEGGVLTYDAFSALLKRGLKQGWGGRGGGDGCMGVLVLLPCERSSIVPGTFQWLPWGPCSYPSPHSNPSPSHSNTDVCIIIFHTTLCVLLFFSRSHTVLIHWISSIAFGSHLDPFKTPSFASTFPNGKEAASSRSSPRSSLFALISVIVMQARQYQQKHAIFSFVAAMFYSAERSSFQNVYWRKQLKPNQFLSAVLLIFCDNVITPFRGQMRTVLVAVGQDEHKCLVSSVSVITAASCWEP